MSPWSSAAPWRPGHGAPAEGSGTSPKAASREAWGGGKAAGCTGRAGSPREEAGWGSGAGGGEGAGARQESSRK